MEGCTKRFVCLDCSKGSRLKAGLSWLVLLALVATVTCAVFQILHQTSMGDQKIVDGANKIISSWGWVGIKTLPTMMVVPAAVTLAVGLPYLVWAACQSGGSGCRIAQPFILMAGMALLLWAPEVAKVLMDPHGAACTAEQALDLAGVVAAAGFFMGASGFYVPRTTADAESPGPQKSLVDDDLTNLNQQPQDGQPLVVADVQTDANDGPPDDTTGPGQQLGDAPPGDDGRDVNEDAGLPRGNGKPEPKPKPKQQWKCMGPEVCGLNQGPCKWVGPEDKLIPTRRKGKKCPRCMDKGIWSNVGPVEDRRRRLSHNIALQRILHEFKET